MKSRHKLMGNLICIIAAGTVLGCDPAKENLPGEATAASLAGTPAVTTIDGGPASAESNGEFPRTDAEASRDLFAGKVWHVAPPRAPPSRPVAPPFPYVFSGSMRDASDADEVFLFLAQGDRNFIVRKGEILGATYRLDDITENEAVFTYLPFQEKQSLAIGNTR